MAPPRVDQRDPAHPKYGKVGVTYPYGDLRFPRIVEGYNSRKVNERRERTFLSPYRDKLSYPNALLISQNTDKGSDVDQNATAVYETLPGPITIDVDPYRETGIPMLTATRNVAANASYTAGEFQPSAVNVSSIADNGDGTLTVTFASNHDLPPKCWVLFASTNSTPVIDGQAVIISVPAENQVVIAGTVSVAGTAAGTMTAINKIVRQLKKVPNNVSMLVKMDTMVAVPGTSALPTRNVSSVVDAGSGVCTIATSAAHGLVAGDWAMLSGTNSVPKVDGPRKILSAPTTTTVTVTLTVTSSGTAAGTLAPMGALARFNEDFRCWQDYDFPDYNTARNFYQAGGSVTGAPYNSHTTYGGAIALPMQDGYHGPCRARKLRCFFVGPPPDSFETNLAPTFVMPSSGTVVIQSGGETVVYKPDLSGATVSSFVSYHTARIPHCLTGPSPAINVVGGTGTALATLNLPESIPPKFTVGDIITMMGKPQKYDSGALWEVIVFLVYVPNTSGLPPP